MIYGRIDDSMASQCDPLHYARWWKWAHAEQLSLCGELERIADSLPNHVNRKKCIEAANALESMITGMHRYENSVLFPYLEATFAPCPELRETFNSLRSQHFEDHCLAEELGERLLQLGSGRTDVNVEATGYMLRGFFEAIRRHVACERNYLAVLCWRTTPFGDAMHVSSDTRPTGELRRILGFGDPTTVN